MLMGPAVQMWGLAPIDSLFVISHEAWPSTRIIKGMCPFGLRVIIFEVVTNQICNWWIENLMRWLIDNQIIMSCSWHRAYKIVKVVSTVYGLVFLIIPKKLGGPPIRRDYFSSVLVLFKTYCVGHGGRASWRGWREEPRYRQTKL